MPRRRDRSKEHTWQRLLQQWRQSGLRAFCALQRLAEPSFYFWRRRLAQPEQARPQPRRAGEPTRRPPQRDGDSPDSGQPTFLPRARARRHRSARSRPGLRPGHPRAGRL
jgi:hypothetical protein